MKRVSLGFILGLVATATFSAANAQSPDKPKEKPLLQTIKERGTLSCGVSQGLPGFSAPDDKGNWAGLMSISAAPWRRRFLMIPPR